MKYEIGNIVEAKSGSLTNWYEGQIVGYDDTNGVYVLHMCEEYPFTPYAGFSEDRIREVSEPTVIHVVLNSSSLGDLNHMREKMGREPLNEINTEQNVEAKAEELFYIFHTGDDTRSWERLVDKSGFHAIARHLATPQNDVQHALQAALESERELRAELEAHKQNSKQILRLNNWLQEHDLGKLGECVTDTIIELLEEAMKPKAPTPHVIRSDEVIQELEAVIAKFKPLKY